MNYIRIEAKVRRVKYLFLRCQIYFVGNNLLLLLDTGKTLGPKIENIGERKYCRKPKPGCNFLLNDEYTLKYLIAIRFIFDNINFYDHITVYE